MEPRNIMDEDIVFCPRKIEKLMKLCIEKVANNLDLYAAEVANLPVSLKTTVLELACKRGKISNKSFHSLTHKKLKVVNLIGCKVTNKMLLSLLSCPQLEELYMNESKVEADLDPSALVSLFRNVPYLSVLSLRHCVAVTDDVVSTISKCCPLMEQLDLGGCCQITDLGAKQIGRLKLKSLDISGSQVTDSGILEMIRGDCGRTLVELCIQRCQITWKAVDYVSYHAPQMQYFNTTLKCDIYTQFSNTLRLKDFSWTVTF